MVATGNVPDAPPVDEWARLRMAIKYNTGLLLFGAPSVTLFGLGLAAIVFLPVIAAGAFAILGSVVCVVNGIVVAVAIAISEGTSRKLLRELSKLLLPTMLVAIWLLFLFGFFGYGWMERIGF